MDIDITSLLDILVILLVFLLKSYNASSLKLDLSKNLDIAASDQRKLGQHALIIQVDKNNNIWVKNKKIASISDMSELEAVLKQGRAIASETEKKEGKLVNLVFDKDLEYANIQKVMNLCAENMHTKFKLIVKGNF
jgi:biopolymer transport protein ExbD